MDRTSPQRSLQDLQRMKSEGSKIVGIVAWDFHMARIAEAAGADFISVGDSVGFHLWGRATPLDVSLEEMLLVSAAVRKGAADSLVSCDFPFGPLQEGPSSALRAAIELIKRSGVDVVKIDDASAHPSTVEMISNAGIPVIAQMGLTPQSAIRLGIPYERQEGALGESGNMELLDRYVAQAKQLEDAGAIMIDFTNSGPFYGPGVVQAVSIPVVGGFGGGPWLDGRIRLAHAAIGYSSTLIDDSESDRYANVASIVYEGLQHLIEDVKASRQIKP